MFRRFYGKTPNFCTDLGLSFLVLSNLSKREKSCIKRKRVREKKVGDGGNDRRKQTVLCGAFECLAFSELFRCLHLVEIFSFTSDREIESGARTNILK